MDYDKFYLSYNAADMLSLSRLQKLREITGGELDSNFLAGLDESMYFYGGGHLWSPYHYINNIYVRETVEVYDTHMEIGRFFKNPKFHIHKSKNYVILNNGFALPLGIWSLSKILKHCNVLDGYIIGEMGLHITKNNISVLPKCEVDLNKYKPNGTLKDKYLIAGMLYKDALGEYFLYIGDGDSFGLGSKLRKINKLLNGTTIKPKSFKISWKDWIIAKDNKIIKDFNNGEFLCSVLDFYEIPNYTPNYKFELYY
jgi:hypothetical protein